MDLTALGLKSWSEPRNFDAERQLMHPRYIFVLLDITANSWLRLHLNKDLN
jgi:hypothetical protein